MTDLVLTLFSLAGLAALFTLTFAAFEIFERWGPLACGGFVTAAFLSAAIITHTWGLA